MNNKFFNSATLSDSIDYVLDNRIEDEEQEIKSMVSALRNTARAFDYKPFTKRLNAVMVSEKKPIGYFENADHAERFIGLVGDYNYFDSFYLAAIYLLTSNEAIWAKTKKYISPTRIDFEGVKKVPVRDGYVLFKTAEDISYGTSHLKMADLVNPRVIGRKEFLLIAKAVAIGLFGMTVVGMQESLYDDALVNQEEYGKEVRDM